jgi:hypothetical protein
MDPVAVPKSSLGCHDARVPSTTCPRCGGNAPRAVAPGYLECQAQVLYNVIPAGAQGNPGEVPLYRPCGNRYQVSTGVAAGPSCDCGMFAVATCTDCGRLLCGDHVNRSTAGQVLCAEDAEARRQTAAAAEAARVAAARAETMSQLEAWERQAAAALSAVADRTERDVRILAADLPSIFTPELRALRPSGWSDPEVTRWFLRVVEAPPQSIRIEAKTLFGGVKTKYVPGWTFPGGSTLMGSYWGEPMPLDIAVLADGRVYYHNMFEPRPGERMKLKVLKRMAELAELRPLVPPRPRH